MDDFWVFGYGSLMWRPGFEFLEQRRARLYGYRRALCIRSYVHRGTPDEPGLVLGLDRGGSCSGIAFKIAAQKKSEVLDYLAGRELVTKVYIERICNIKLSDGARVPAYCYVADTSHKQYAGSLNATEAAEIVSTAIGQSGKNVEYVSNTVAHLQSMNLRDHWLEDVARKLS